MIVLEVSPETLPPKQEQPTPKRGRLGSDCGGNKPGEFLKPNQKLNALYVNMSFYIIKYIARYIDIFIFNI